MTVGDAVGCATSPRLAAALVAPTHRPLSRECACGRTAGSAGPPPLVTLRSGPLLPCLRKLGTVPAAPLPSGLRGVAAPGFGTTPSASKGGWPGVGASRVKHFLVTAVMHPRRWWCQQQRLAWPCAALPRGGSPAGERQTGRLFVLTDGTRSKAWSCSTAGQPGHESALYAPPAEHQVFDLCP